MAEDLGNIGDFDFNDVVIDVYINYYKQGHRNNYGIIVLQAAGGTMPLYVEGNPNERRREVHEEFCVPVNQMVNTGGDGSESVNRPIAVWRFTPVSANPDDIKLYVDNGTLGLTYEISSEVGKAPGKFAVPVSVRWSPERVNIKQTYPKFTEWVSNQKKPFWK